MTITVTELLYGKNLKNHVIATNSPNMFLNENIIFRTVGVRKKRKSKMVNKKILINHFTWDVMNVCLREFIKVKDIHKVVKFDVLMFLYYVLY